MSRPSAGVATAPQASPADKWISRAAAGTVPALAGAISYSHMRQLAQEHGQAGWHAHAFPLSVDGLEIVASLVLLAEHRSGRRRGWLPWAALVTGTAGSLAANIATAGPGTISQIIAGWPALALLIAVKLLSGMLNRPAVPVPPRLTAGAPTADAPLPSYPARTTRAAASHRHEPAQPKIDRSADAAAHDADGPLSLAPGTAELLPAARTARDKLHRDGLRLTRDALATSLRDTGHPIRHSRLTPLLHAFRSETTTPSPTRPADKAA